MLALAVDSVSLWPTIIPATTSALVTLGALGITVFNQARRDRRDDAMRRLDRLNDRRAAAYQDFVGQLRQMQVQWDDNSVDRRKAVQVLDDLLCSVEIWGSPLVRMTAITTARRSRSLYRDRRTSQGGDDPERAFAEQVALMQDAVRFDLAVDERPGGRLVAALMRSRPRSSSE